MVLELIALALISLGAFFFVAGTIGLLRFPDTLCRLHALTKADGLGLGLTCLGVALMAGSAGEVARVVLIWFFVALSSAVCGHLIARHVRRAAESGGR
jgi:multicomponent Na+:H+ antiporter subunit G